MSKNIKRDFSPSLYKSITSAQHALGDSQKSGHKLIDCIEKMDVTICKLII